MAEAVGSRNAYGPVALSSQNKVPYGRACKCAHRKGTVILRCRVYVTVLDHLRRSFDHIIITRIILCHRYDFQSPL